MVERILRSAIQCVYGGAKIESAAGWDCQRPPAKDCSVHAVLTGLSTLMAGSNRAVAFLVTPEDWRDASIYDPPRTAAEQL